MYAVDTNVQGVDGDHSLCLCNFPQSEEVFDSLDHCIL